MASRFDTFTNLTAYALERADEPTTAGESDFSTLVEDLIFRRWRWLATRHPWVGLTKDPPGVFLATDDITTLTLTIAAAGTSVAATLSATYASSLAGYKIRPSGKAWAARITAHTAGTAALTLDAAPETVAAGTACTIFQDEYDLASDLGVFISGLWTQEGDLVELVSEEELRARYADPPSGGWPPDQFCRISQTKIRLSHYPTQAGRIEYPYTYVPSDPSGSSTLAFPSHLRPVLAEYVVADLMEQKSDRRAIAALTKAEVMYQDAIVYESRLKTGQGVLSHTARPGPYADRRRHGGAGW